MAQSCNKIKYKNGAQQQIMAKMKKKTNSNKFQKKLPRFVKRKTIRIVNGYSTFYAQYKFFVILLMNDDTLLERASECASYYIQLATVFRSLIAK